jgi:quercetin dioxygenase-like cupin family protein
MRLTNSILLLLAAAAACHDAPTATGDVTPPEFTWVPAPAVFPAGAQMAVLQGDPGGAAEFTVRLRFPDGYRIPPHTHPTDEHVTVISGTFKVGMGERYRTDSMLTLPEGGFVTAPAGHAHFAVAQGATIVQVHAIGPFALTYVDPADTPHIAAGH